MSKATREVRLVGGVFHGNSVKVSEDAQAHSEVRETATQRAVHVYVPSDVDHVFSFFRTIIESK